MSMMDIGRKRKSEIIELRNKGLTCSEIAIIMRSRGCEISSGTVSRLIHQEDVTEKKNPFEDMDRKEILKWLDDSFDKPGFWKGINSTRTLALLVKALVEKL